MNIEQYVINQQISFFEETFKKKWRLKPYHSTSQPLIFFGFQGLEHFYENHKGFKVVLPSTPHDLPNFKNLKSVENTILIVETSTPPDYYIPDKVVVLEVIIPIKDYSSFQPTPLGDSIYLYSGFSNGWNLNPANLVKSLQSKLHYNIITTNHFDKKDMYDIEYLKGEFYDKCFVNLNFTKGHGMTTCREFALMGRKTIAVQNPYRYSCLIECDSEEAIVAAVNKEASKIGTIQNSIDVHTYKSDCLNIDTLLNFIKT